MVNVFGHANPSLRLNVQRGVMRCALHILRNAWSATLADLRVSTASKEDAITDVLCRNMERAKRRMKPVPQMRFHREPQSDAVDDDTPLGLIDIMVAYTWDSEVYLVLECKRIWSTDNDLALKYVRDGVSRFASGKYGAGHALGAMIGYVLCGNRDGCIERVENVLRNEPHNETGFDNDYGWTPSNEWMRGEEVYQTRHEQQTVSSTIELVHVFLIMAEYS